MPRQVDHNLRRSEVAELAARLIATHGPEGLSLRAIAAAAGVSTTAVTHYFSRKQDLLLHAYSAAVAHAGERIAAVPADDPNRLQAHAEAVLPLDAPRRADWRTWFGFFGAAICDPDLAALQRRRVTSFRRLLAQIITAEQQAGRLEKTLDPERQARKLLALIHGIASEASFDPEDWPPARQRELIAEAIAAMRGPQRAGDR